MHALTSHWIAISCLTLLGCAAEPGSPKPADPAVTPCVPDAHAAFSELPAVAAPRSLPDGDVFRGDSAWHYTLTLENGLGIDNHFQGVARIGNTLWVSGSDAMRLRAEVLSARLAGDPQRDRVMDVHVLDSGVEWHGGGIAVLDDVLVVPTENTREALGERRSTVRLFHAPDPHTLTPIAELDRGPGSVTHAAGIARTDRGLLLVTWDDQAFALYRSASADPADGFDPHAVATIHASDIAIETAEAGTPGVHGQAVTLLTQCDGEVFAVLNDNTLDLPVDGGVDFADLYALELGAGPAQMRKIASRALSCPPEQGCNLRAAGGVWVSPAGTLTLYSVPHHRDGDRQHTPLGVFE